MSRGLNAVSVTPYTRYEVIGRGSYGIVYKGIHNDTRSTVAIKVLNLDTVEDEVVDIQKEIVLLKSLKSDDAQNIVKYHGSFLNGTRLWIIMDYCEGGSIRTLMKSGRIEERFIIVIIREVLAALSYIHKSDIIHRDVKAANILVTYDGRVQLCDFGVAAQLAANHFKRNTFVGTPYWMAPEVISEGLSYNFKADIWSLGITIYEIATGNPPYADQEPMRAIFLIPRSSPARLEGTNFSTQLKEFVGTCLSERPEERPSAQELLKMKIIKNAAKVPTTILRDLIVRYEAWRKSGGVRKSLALGGDLDADDDFDGQFGLDDDAGNGQDGWDFDTVRRSMIVDPPRPTWEQSADATEDLLRTIRPTTQHDDKRGEGVAPPLISSANNSTNGSRYEHPLLKLFGDHNDTSKANDSGAPQLMPLDVSGMRSKAPAQNDLVSHVSEPSTPSSDFVSIEMPALNATSLVTTNSKIAQTNSASSDSQSREAANGEVKGNHGHRERALLGLTPSRQNSLDHFGGLSVQTNYSNSQSLNQSSPDVQNTSELSASHIPAYDSTTITRASPTKSSFKAPSPERSRPVSPIRSSAVSRVSPPTSPSRTTYVNPHQSLLLSAAPTMPQLLSKTGYNPSLGLQAQFTGSTQSLPDILPRPSISGSSRERSSSSSAVPQVQKHIKRPSNLVLQMPSLDAMDDAYLPPSPSRTPMPIFNHTTYSSTPLSQEVNQVANAGPDVPASTTPADTPTTKKAGDLPPLSALDLNVLTTNDDAAVVNELTRVVGEMLQQLVRIEDGLTSMANR